MSLFHLSKTFPRDETYSLTDRVRRSSRSVSANIAEAWQKRRYEAAFVSKLTDAAAEAAETQNWIDYAVGCEYVAEIEGLQLRDAYEQILRTLNAMMLHAPKWCTPQGVKK